MTASCAFQSKISTYPEDFPFLAAAGVLFLQFYNISNFITVTHVRFPFCLPFLFYSTWICENTCPMGALITRSAIRSLGVASRLMTTRCFPVK